MNCDGMDSDDVDSEASTVSLDGHEVDNRSTNQQLVSGSSI